jgi:hypothetical protein
LIALVGIVIRRGGEGRHGAFLHRARGWCIPSGEQTREDGARRGIYTSY